MLFNMFRRAKEKKQNDKDEFDNTLQLAKQGDPDAQMLVALYYFLGQGVQSSFDQFEFWLACAVLNGNKDAMKYVKEHFVGEYANFQERFFMDTCPHIIVNYPQYIPHYDQGN